VAVAGVPEADPALAQWSAADRMTEALATGADVMLTASALCQRSFAEMKEHRLPVQDVLDFLQQSL